MLRERSQLYEELRESRKEALQLGQELDKAREGGSEREMELQQKVQELTCRFHSLENDVRSAKPAKGERETLPIDSSCMPRWILNSDVL